MSRVAAVAVPSAHEPIHAALAPAFIARRWRSAGRWRARPARAHKPAGGDVGGRVSNGDAALYA
ncbi:MAG: hypothetical protein ACK5U8_10680, partial [Deltaproteobacteria bacterium]